MTDTTLKTALKEAYACVPASEVILDTLEFSIYTPPQQEDVIARIIKGSQVSMLDLYENGKDSISLVVENGVPADFQPINFDIGLAPVTSDPSPEMSITLDNIGLVLFDSLDSALKQRKRILVKYRPYLSSRLEDGPQITPPPKLNITEVSANLAQIHIRARIFDIADRTFPSIIYDTDTYRGLLG